MHWPDGCPGFWHEQQKALKVLLPLHSLLQWQAPLQKTPGCPVSEQIGH